MPSTIQIVATAACVSALAVTVAAQNVQINGAGATFPNPIYSKWFSEYEKVKPNVRINYQPIGSGGGINQIKAQTVFFGATDGPMTDQQLLDSPSRILHFPTVLGAVVPVYNVPGAGDLKFTGAVLADIFLGKITKWNDPAIAKVNPGAKLPSTDITVVHRSDGSGTSYIWVDFLAKVSPEWKKKVGVATSLQWPAGVGGKGNDGVKLPATDITVAHRSDGSGTTYIWVDYLSKVSPEWKSKVGVATAVNWPVGVGGKGNEGVAGLVTQTPGSIGYVELIYALQNKISYGSVQNLGGEFVKATEQSVTAAAAVAASKMPADFRVSITNAEGKGAYPVASFTWLLLYENPKDKNQAKIMVDFVKWALSEGQKSAGSLGYAPLPDGVVKLELAALDKIKVS
jgi:phosphate transport system substrate-binding protein